MWGITVTKFFEDQKFDLIPQPLNQPNRPAYLPNPTPRFLLGQFLLNLDQSNLSFVYIIADIRFLGGEDFVGMEDFSVLPFGPIEDPVRHLMLSTTWPKLSEHLVTETETYSDLDPLQVRHASG